MFNVILNRCDLIVAAVDFNGVPVQGDHPLSAQLRLHKPPPHFKKGGHRVRQVEPVSSP
jgi:hypothetical protein